MRPGDWSLKLILCKTASKERAAAVTAPAMKMKMRSTKKRTMRITKRRLASKTTCRS
jgi:hypothetical protein